jgi:hypothetical protein
LTDTLRNMLDTEWKAFRRAYPHTPKPSAIKARASFMRAMTRRLSKRLYEMKADQSQSEETNDCRQIVLSKLILSKTLSTLPSTNQDSGVLHLVNV